MTVNQSNRLFKSKNLSKSSTYFSSETAQSIRYLAYENQAKITLCIVPLSMLELDNTVVAKFYSDHVRRRFLCLSLNR